MSKRVGEYLKDALVTELTTNQELAKELNQLGVMLVPIKQVGSHDQAAGPEIKPSTVH